jgi:outer membrane protein assembly factor BamB
MVKELGIHPRAIMIPGHDTHGSPAAYKEFLYVPTGNGVADDAHTVPKPDAPSLVCLRKATGKVVWKDNSPGKNLLHGHYASPLVIETADRAQVIHTQGDGWMRSFDAETGKLIWKFDTNRKDAKNFLDRGENGEARNFVVATPVYADSRVYFATGRDPESCSGPGRLFCIDPTKTGDISPELDDGKGKGKPNPNSAVVWEFAGDGPKEIDRMHLSLSSVAVHDGLLIAADGSGYVHCLDAKSGKRHWSHDTKATVHGHPLVVDGKVYVGTDDGVVWVFGLQKTKQVIAKNKVDAPVRAPPVFANGLLYVLTEKTLHAIAEKR